MESNVDHASRTLLKPHPDDAAEVRGALACVERLDALQRTMDERLEGLQRTMDERFGAVIDRLDRLISLTIQERAASTERMGEIERRLTRLEERAGMTGWAPVGLVRPCSRRKPS